MIKEELAEWLERVRRARMHIVKPADSEMMKRPDQEIYQGISDDSEKGPDNGSDGTGR